MYNRDASFEPEVLDIISQAEGIFFEGIFILTKSW